MESLATQVGAVVVVEKAKVMLILFISNKQLNNRNNKILEVVINRLSEAVEEEATTNPEAAEDLIMNLIIKWDQQRAQ